jgi:hypothetical protein
MTFVDDVGLWVFVEYAFLAGSMVGFVNDDEADELLASASCDAVVIKMPTRALKGRGWGLWCVPLTAQVAGIPSCALLPAGLLRDCLRHGGEIIIGGD